MSILLVEDNHIDVKVFERAMRTAGIDFPLECAKDGQDALDILNHAPPARPFIILLDINMPRMDGFEFLDAMRAEAKLRNLIVFMFSTSSAPSDRERAYDFNVAGYITKGSTEDTCKVVEFLADYSENVTLV